MIDLTDATARTAAVVRGVAEDRLDDPSPCPGMPVGNLIAHLHGLSIAFRDAAHKITGPTTSTGPDPAKLVLPTDWRESTPELLAELAAAWSEPASWQGITQAGGQTMPGEVTGLVALNEVVLHGWDLAVATGQPYDVSPDVLAAVEQFCAGIPDEPAERAGLFGPRVKVPRGAPHLDRVLGLAGRDPSWAPPRAVR